MGKWTGLDKPITLAAADAEQDRLFDRPVRRPSPATIAALRRTEQLWYRRTLPNTTPKKRNTTQHLKRRAGYENKKEQDVAAVTDIETACMG